MKFGINQRIRFDTEDGAYSVVTPREFHDSQITLTDEEAKLIIDFYGFDNIQVGNVKSNPQKAKKSFLLYPEGKTIQLNLVYPKPNKPELRLYIGQRAGFKPEGGCIWFLFVKEGNIWIGAMEEATWRSQSQILLYDESEATYQDALQELDEIKVSRLREKDVYTRNRSLALERIAMANFRCEVSPQHQLFKSRKTNNYYLEAHHLVPISLQGNLNRNLDISENIFSLCPYCHRAIHHAEATKTKSIIDTLIVKRPEVLNTVNIQLPELYSYYAVEEII